MENQTPDNKYKKWLIAVSVLLAAVLCVMALQIFFKDPAGGTEGASADGTAVTGGASGAGQTAAAGETAKTGGTQSEADSAEGATDGAAADNRSAVEAHYTEGISGSLSHEGCTLEQVVIFSRHNIRSPLTSNGDLAETLTPHKWFKWTTGSSELSLRGGVAETEMGQYFRKWLEAEGLFPENYRPDEGEVRIYANSLQRTIATAQFFAAGLMPTADIEVEYHGEFDEMNPVFSPSTVFASDEYIEAVKRQTQELYGDKLLSLSENYELIKDVLDFEDSQAYREGTVTDFPTDDTEISYEAGDEPYIEGSLGTMCAVSDALILQYYEEPDKELAGFGHLLTLEQWKEISEVKDIYNEVKFCVPLVAYNVSHPLLQLIRSEMTQEGRQFTFLCGHDSNIAAILTALKTEEYDLPATVETSAPIGGKIVFSRWHGADGEELMSADLVYASTEQLRELTVLDPDTHPVIIPLSFEGLEKNGDGLYRYEDILQRFDDAISEYDRIVDQYSGGAQELDDAA